MTPLARKDFDHYFLEATPGRVRVFFHSGVAFDLTALHRGGRWYLQKPDAIFVKPAVWARLIRHALGFFGTHFPCPELNHELLSEANSASPTSSTSPSERP